MSATYFWDGKKVRSFGEQFFMATAEKHHQLGRFCVDGFRTDPEMRYGKFGQNTSWEHVPIEQFPKEFRAHLLLLGVS